MSSTAVLLRRRQRIGQRRDDLLAHDARRRRCRGRIAAHMRAHQRERELAGQQFVIGEPRPGRTFRRDIGRLGGAMQRRSASLKDGKLLRASARPRPAIPAAPAFSPALHQRRARTLIEREAFGQRIDRLDQRQSGEACLVDHAVGMHHLQHAVVELGVPET